MKFKIAKVVGLNTDQQASLVISSFCSEDNLFLAALSLACDDAFTRGRQSLSELEDLYCDPSSESNSSSAKLESVFDEAVKKLADAEDVSVLLAAISGQVLYLKSSGTIQAYLKRGEKVSPLNSVPNQLISGYIQDGDRILLSTQSVVTSLGNNLSQAISLDINTWEDEMRGKLDHEENQGFATLLISIEPDVVTPPVEQEEFRQSIPMVASELSEGAAPLKKLARLISFLKQSFPKSGRSRLILAGILLLVLILGVGFKYKSVRDSERAKQYESFLQQSRDDLDAASGLATLSPKEASDKLAEAKSLLEKALKLDSKGKEALELKNKLDNSASSILQQFAATNFSEYLDLSLIKSGFKPSQLSFLDGKLLVLDQISKSLAIIDVAKKSNQIIAGKDSLGEAKYASLGSLAFVYSDDKGVVRVDLSNKKATMVAKPDKEWGGIADIAGFASNVYVLDSKNNQIWKYLPVSDGYSDKRAYLTAGSKADFSGAIRMQIESSVYVLKQGGEILRFTKGGSDFFSIGGLDKNIKDPKSFFVSSETDNLYLLDSGNSRLLVLSKVGAYKSQYQGDKFSSAVDLVVDEKAKKVYLLDGSKIYSMELK